jgi:hypothetical protein
VRIGRFSYTGLANPLCHQRGCEPPSLLPGPPNCFFWMIICLFSDIFFAICVAQVKEGIRVLSAKRRTYFVCGSLLPKFADLDTLPPEVTSGDAVSFRKARHRYRLSHGRKISPRQSQRITDLCNRVPIQDSRSVSGRCCGAEISRFFFSRCQGFVRAPNLLPTRLWLDDEAARTVRAHFETVWSR